MIDLLKKIFDNPNWVKDAIKRSYSNSQRNKVFSTWIAVLRRDASMARYDYNHRALRDPVMTNIRLELQATLINE